MSLGGGKHHASEVKLLDVISILPVDIPSKGFTSPACAMPPKYIVLGEGSYKKAYQHYPCSKYIDWVQGEDKKKDQGDMVGGDAPLGRQDNRDYY